MHVRRGSLVAAAALGIVAAAGPAQAQTNKAHGPWLGAWKLNVEKSTYNPGPGPAPGTVSTFTMVPHGADGFKYTIESTRPGGRTSRAELIGKFDGKDYPETGNPSADTNRFRILGDRSYEVVDTKDGVDTLTIVITISPDGKTRTSETKGKNPKGEQVHNVAIWERQPGPATAASAAGASGGAAAQAGQATQTGLPRGQATVVTASEFKTVLNTLGTQKNIDKVVRTVDTKGSAGNISIAQVAYRSGPQNWDGNANEHSSISEVFYVTKGSATFVFGGDLAGAKEFDRNSEPVRKVFGPGRGGKVSGHKTVKATQGDSVVLPPNTPHQIIEVTEDFEMVVIRIDPAKVLEHE